MMDRENKVTLSFKLIIDSETRHSLKSELHKTRSVHPLHKRSKNTMLVVEQIQPVYDQNVANVSMRLIQSRFCWFFQLLEHVYNPTHNLKLSQ